MTVQPDERINRATTRLDELGEVPAEAVQSVDALLHKIETRLVLTDESEQGWRDVVDAARSADRANAPQVASLMRTVKTAPTTPLPPKGWLSLDMAVLDVAKDVAPESA